MPPIEDPRAGCGTSRCLRESPFCKAHQLHIQEAAPGQGVSDWLLCCRNQIIQVNLHLPLRLFTLRRASASFRQSEDCRRQRDVRQRKRAQLCTRWERLILDQAFPDSFMLPIGRNTQSQPYFYVGLKKLCIQLALQIQKFQHRYMH